ncbi:acetolactate synthase small subunit [Halobacteriales archaeon QH_7_66_36]|nr:MAG: acetolactate synthase small subunit [Halobacteriales archaeon QH_7_66_36]
MCVSSDEEPPKRGLKGPAPEERARPEGRRNSQGIRIDPDVEAEQLPRRTTITALVSNQPGVLSEVSGLFSRRQFNIESLTVGPTQNPDWSRVTVVVEEPDPNVEQIEKQLDKLVPVIHTRELGDDAVRRELVLVKVSADNPERIHAITEMYDGRTLDAGPRTVTVELTGSERVIDDALDAFRQFDVREIARTGHTALARGETKTSIAPDRVKTDE